MPLEPTKKIESENLLENSTEVSEVNPERLPTPEVKSEEVEPPLKDDDQGKEKPVIKTQESFPEKIEVSKENPSESKPDLDSLKNLIKDENYSLDTNENPDFKSRIVQISRDILEKTEGDPAKSEQEINKTSDLLTSDIEGEEKITTRAYLVELLRESLDKGISRESY